MNNKNKICRECKRELSSEDFYNRRNICKKCYIKAENEREANSAEKEVQKLIDKDIIKQGEKEAGISLYRSC